jgi:molybdenum-dependent DNA-binding transcriptional regulator ModE
MGVEMQFSGLIASRIKLRDIHILMAVEQAGSMNKAAVVLNMTQPAVSRSIAELERALGVSLLDRNAQGVSPGLPTVVRCSMAERPYSTTCTKR